MFLVKGNIYKKISSKLSLDKPLVIFDVETTGKGISTDKIVEIAYVKIWPDGRVKKQEILLDPEMEIDPEASAIHGIQDEDVAGQMKFKEVAQEIWDIFNGCYYGGFNILEFDLPILRREFIRVGMDFEVDHDRVIDSKVILKFMDPWSLSMAYEHYCGKRFVQEHAAMVDTEVAVEILAKQLDFYSELGSRELVRKIHDLSTNERPDNTRKFFWKDGEAHFAFSKHRGKKLSEVAESDPDFLDWIIAADFSEETKIIVRLAQKNKSDKEKK